MDQVTLRAEARTETGSRPGRRRRAAGEVPAVLYGRGLDPISVSVNRRDLYAALHTEAGSNALINLAVEGSKKPYLTVAREIQRHPVRGEIAHVDFISISLDEAIAAEVFLEFVGTPEAVKHEGAILETIRTAVHLKALPMDIPGHITVDISDLEIGTTLKVADLPAIDGVEYLDDPETDLVTVAIPRVVVEEEPVAEGEEDAAAAAEGAEPEAGDEG